MPSAGHLEKVAIVGATGHLGSYFVDELVKTGRHTVTALTRDSSKGKFPEGVKVVEVDYSDELCLVAALQGQEFLAIVLGAAAPPQIHSQVVQAAAKASIPYIMPTAYGADITNKDMVRDDIYHQGVFAKVQEIERLGISHIIMSCGFWYEWSLAGGENCFAIDIKAKKATFFDDGNTKLSVSTLRQCGRALALLLSLPESGAVPVLAEWKNKPFRIGSFSVSQRDMLNSIQRARGTTDADWDIKHEPSAKRVADGLAALKLGDGTGFVKAMYSRAFYPSENFDYEAKQQLVNEMIGLPKEDLDETTRWVVAKIESGWDPRA